MAYNPADHTVSAKALGVSGNVPTDGRSMFYDTVNFVSRAFVSTAEVIAYLTTAAQRNPAVPIVINTGGTLLNGVITGGTNELWHFKDGKTDGSLVRMITGSTSAADLTSGTLDGDRLPGLSTTKKGGVPATGTPSGKFLKDDGTWAATEAGTLQDAVDLSAQVDGTETDFTLGYTPSNPGGIIVVVNGVIRTPVTDYSVSGSTLTMAFAIPNGQELLVYNGVTGATVAGMVGSNNLSEITNATTARTNLGLGTLATQSGTFSGTSSGTNTGDQTTITGNAGTATALQTARTIGGVSFNGTANTTVASATGGFTVTGGALVVTGVAVTGLVEASSGHDEGTGITAKSCTLELAAPYAYTINELKIDAGAGTATVALEINGTPVTGISAVSVSTTLATATASAANSVAIGNKVTLTISSPTSLDGLQWTVKTTRV